MVEVRRIQYRKHRKKRIAGTKAWRRRNPGKDLEYMRRYRQGIRAKLIEAYGGKCECCGETETKFLTLEHREGGGRKHRGNKSSLSLYREVIKAGYPKIYTILCMNCNFAKGMYGQCPHAALQLAKS